MIKMIAFDIDGTLALSRSPLDEKMAGMIKELLDKVLVSLITGAKLEQIQYQVIDKLPLNSNLLNLHLMPTCGTKYFTFLNNELVNVYEKNIPKNLRKDVIRSLEIESKKLGFWEENPYGNIIEDRGSQVTYSALGQDAPIEKREKWDPEGTKKESLRFIMANLFPNLEVRSGGTTSVDITQKGLDKAYGMNQLITYTNISAENILFIGDRLDINGNDYPVIFTGVQTYHTKSIEDTYQKIKSLNL